MGRHPSQRRIESDFRDLGYEVGGTCGQHRCALLGVDSNWLRVTFMGMHRPDFECCDCIIAKVGNLRADVVAVELKSARYNLDQARRQLEGGLNLFRIVADGAGYTSPIYALPVILSPHHTPMERRVGLTMHVRFGGRKLTIITRRCGEAFQNLRPLLSAQ